MKRGWEVSLSCSLSLVCVCRERGNGRIVRIVCKRVQTQIRIDICIYILTDMVCVCVACTHVTVHSHMFTVVAYANHGRVQVRFPARPSIWLPWQLVAQLYITSSRLRRYHALKGQILRVSIQARNPTTHRNPTTYYYQDPHLPSLINKSSLSLSQG